MATWRSVRVPDLIEELKRRDLPFKGRKGTLVARLEQTDRLPIDREGRDSQYKEEVKRHQAAALANLTTFPYFTQLPLEVQRYIWLFSLPEPRVLRYNNIDGSGCGHKLFFRKDSQPPNPSALFTCRESRAIALKRYKLCFGTTNIYADLPGGDILYLSKPDIIREWERMITTMRDGRRRTTSNQEKLCDSVVKDLDEVTHIILPSQFWLRSHISNNISLHVSDGVYTRTMLRNFKGLKRVSLASDQNSDARRAFVGYTTISDPFFEQPIRAETRTFLNLFRSRFAGADRPPHRVRNSDWEAWMQEIPKGFEEIRFITGFQYSPGRKDEVENVIPEIRVVELGYVPCTPRRIKENYFGRPRHWCCESDMKEKEEEWERSNSRYVLRRP